LAREKAKLVEDVETAMKTINIKLEQQMDKVKGIISG
jgi:hypothetical protein